MRDRIYLAVFMLVAGLLLYLGRDLLQGSAVVTWGLTFGGTTAAAILGMTLYRVQLELRASRHALARKEAELNFALEVQRALFPRQFPADGGLEFDAVCLPAQGISGDYYDVLRLPNGRVVFVIADVSGKGISAAILMSNVHAVLRIVAAEGRSPGEVCAQLNRHLCQVTEAARFATFVYAEWEPQQRRLRYVNAGHNAPFLLSPGGCRRLESGGPPLGIFPESEFPAGEIGLQPADLLVFYSDGITEAGVSQGEQFGESRLEALLHAHYREPLTEIRQQVLNAARKWTGTELDDDMTLLLVRARETAKEATS